MKIFFKIIVLCLLYNNAYSQEGCATELLQGQVDYMDETRAERDLIDLDVMDGHIVEIPFVAHIIRRANGAGGLSSADLNLAMSQMNTAYEQVNFEFVLCSVNYIDNDNHFGGVSYSTSATSEEYTMALPNLVSDAVNVFFVPYAGGYCGWSSFPSYRNDIGKDWTVMDNRCATNGSTLAHEMGHYFNLYHTHQGLSSYLNIYADELVDGSNCGTNVGDELCDTPADPRLSSSCVNSNCVYTCNQTDANGDTYTPDPNNIMSYSQKHCRTFFSPEQIQRIQRSYIMDRNYLAAGCACPESLSLADDIPGGNYNAENAIVSTGIPDPAQAVHFTAGNYIELNHGFLAASTTEFVASIGDCNNAARLAGKRTVVKNENKTVKAETVNPEKITCKVFPNPFSQETTIEFSLPETTKVHLEVFDLTGKSIAIILNHKAMGKGLHQTTFDASQLPDGIYALRINTKNETITQKMIVRH